MENSIQHTLADDGTATVVAHGEFDFSNAGELARRLCEAVADGSPATLRVDLAGASFIDSTGLGALIEGYRAAIDTGTKFVVVNPTPTFRRVLTVTGLCGFFGLSDGRAEGSATSAMAEDAAQASGA